MKIYGGAIENIAKQTLPNNPCKFGTFVQKKTLGTLRQPTVGRKLTEPMKTQDPIWKGPSSVYNLIFYKVKETSVERELDALRNKSNTDILGFDSKLLRLSSCIIAKYITFFINKSISTAHVLLDWKKPE